ncbi:hypothetical protein D3C71_1232130 [compost metagenome]
MAPVVQAQVVEFLGMVAGDQHDGVVGLAAVAQGLQQLAQQPVGVMHRGAVAVALRRGHVVLAQRQEVDVGGHRRGQRRVVRRQVVRRVGAVEEDETEPVAVAGRGDVRAQRIDDVAVARGHRQRRRRGVQLRAHLGEGGAVELGAVQRRAAIQVQVVALPTQDVEQLRTALLAEHAVPIPAGQAVEQAEQPVAGGVAGAVMPGEPLRLPGQRPGIGHGGLIQGVGAQRLHHHHQHVGLGVALATQRPQRVLQLTVARVGQARLGQAAHPQLVHVALGGDRLGPRQVGPLAGHRTVAARVVIGRGRLPAGHQQQAGRPRDQHRAAPSAGRQQAPAGPCQQALGQQHHHQDGRRLHPGLPGQGDLVLQRAAEHHVHHHRVEVEAIQREDLGIHQQQAQPQTLADHRRDAQRARAARPQADGQW